MHAYGPVPSRRLGRSIGVSPILAKTCTYSCVYCQLGKTKSIRATRKIFHPKKEILRDIEKVVEKAKGYADYITFAGDGEPTLSSDLGWLIKECKKRWPLPVAVITNGSLLFHEEVRQELMAADVLLPTFDAAAPDLFKAINHPHRSITYDKMLQGQIALRSEYRGQLWVEVMLVKGVNDGEQELNELKAALNQIHPDRIYINVPIRPPAEPWVEIPDPPHILMAQEILDQAIDLRGYESGWFGIQPFKNAEQAILEIGSRHPLREDQAKEIERRLGASDVVEKLLQEGKLNRVRYREQTYLLPSTFKRGTATKGAHHNG